MMPNEMTSQPLLYTLDEIEGTHLALVGGKAFRLAVLRQHQLDVWRDQGFHYDYSQFPQ